MVRLDRCNGRCHILDDPSGKICVPYKTENVNLHVFDLITMLNEEKD